MIQRISPEHKISGPTVAIIVAAGKGERMGAGLPKQYRLLNGKAVLRHTIEAFTSHPDINSVLVVIHPDHREFYERTVNGLDLLSPVIGGLTRQESVKHALEALQEIAPRYVLVHDAARCFIDEATISRVAHALKLERAVLPVVAVKDTLKRVEEGKVITVARENTYSAQTPQGFDYKILYDLHRNTVSPVTDDAALAEAAAIPVSCVAGCENNFKITSEEDWMRAQRMMESTVEYRTGSGFDVHKFILPAGDIRLCGIAIPHSHTLEGHSDADVGLHALVDAILGALALGDIGTHFPPSDNRWKGADSAVFVAYCKERLEERGARLVNADITIICEAPKVGPHRTAMQKRVAELLDITERRISIKATTTEGLGFTGRREGIAAQAIVTLAVPTQGE